MGCPVQTGKRRYVAPRNADLVGELGVVVDQVGKCLVAFLKSPNLKPAKQETSTPRVQYEVCIEAISNSKMLLSFQE